MLGIEPKGNMLLHLKNNLTKIRLKYQDGTTSSIITEPNLWGAIVTGTLTQDEEVIFNVNTSSGTVNISGYQLLFSDEELAFDVDFEQIYSYPNNGTFTFDGMPIVIN